MARKSRKNVGVIGLGIIGSRVVTALRGSGYHVFVWNRSPRVVPNFLASPAEVAEVCDIIQIFVPDAQALFEVIEGFDGQLTERHTILCNATVGPEATLEAAKMVHEQGAKFLDAPFTGSKIAAEKRELVYYIGGSDETLEKVEPVLRASSRQILKIGEVGHAATIKIATNMLAAVAVQTLAEALAIVKRSGIEPERLMDALEQHGVRSGLTDMKLPRMVQGDFEPHFAMKHMFKDVQLAIHVANSLDIDIPATTATAGVMYGGLNRGWAELDFSALVKVYAEEEEEVVEPESAPKIEKDAASETTKANAETAEAKGDGPPKETLVHMMPPPPREELAASLLKPSASDAPVSELGNPSSTPDPEPKAEAPGPEAKKDTKPEVKTIEVADEVVPAKSSAESQSSGLAKSKDEPAPPADDKTIAPARLNPIRRWFVARSQSNKP